ncbi:MAG TPA: hypothetical protein VGB67_02730 [Fibrella sp.]
MFKVTSTAKSSTVKVEMDYRTARLLTALLGAVGDAQTSDIDGDCEKLSTAYSELCDNGLRSPVLFADCSAITVAEDLL